MSIDLTTDATVPTDTTATVWVLEDSSGDGKPDNEESISVDDGVNTYTLSSFNGGESTYWTHIELETADSAVTPEVDSIEIQPE